MRLGDRELPLAFLYTELIDFRNHIDRFTMVVDHTLELNPFSEHLFPFTNRRHDKATTLYSGMPRTFVHRTSGAVTKMRGVPAEPSFAVARVQGVCTWFSENPCVPSASKVVWTPRSTRR